MKLKVEKDHAMIVVGPADGSRLVEGMTANFGDKWNKPTVSFDGSPWSGDGLSPEAAMDRAKLIAKVALRTQQEYLKIPKKERT
jgi:hypothetical protein